MSDNGDDDVQVIARNQTWFKVDNKTGYKLVEQGCFADWGDFAEPPSSADPYTASSGGHLVSSRSQFKGTAGIVGYKIEGEQTLYLRLLASNPYMDAKDNEATAAILMVDHSIDQGNYNWLYYQPKGEHNSTSFEGQTLKVSSRIGQADECTALFEITLE